MDIDTKEIKTYDELISIAEKLNSNEERLELLGKYFMENVTYAYEIVDILGQSANYDQEVFMDIQSRYNVWDESQREGALQEVENYLRKTMAGRFHNQELLEETLRKRMAAIRKQYGVIFEANEETSTKGSNSEERKSIIRIKNKHNPAKPRRIADLVGILLETQNGEKEYENLNLSSYNEIKEGTRTECGAMQAYEPYTRMENGLLKNAVCMQYAPFIKKYCDYFKIPCEEVRGKGTVAHAWAIIRLGDEIIHFDPTNMAFERDGYGAQREGKPEDWLGTSIEKMFEMQPGREIYNIGNSERMLIQKKNYEEYSDDINKLVGYDYSGIKTYEEFIEKAKKMQSQEEQIRFVCGYFKQNAEYDYKTLFDAVCTYGVEKVFFEDIPLKSDSYQSQLVEKTHQDLQNLQVYLRKSKSYEGDNPILSQIVKLNNEENSESSLQTDEDRVQYAFKIWEDIMLPELEKHTQNESIIADFFEEYLKNVADKIGKTAVTLQNEEGEINGFVFEDMIQNLVGNMRDLDKKHPKEENNGLIKKGVCKHYSEEIKKALDELEIENETVGGISECGHAWNMVRLDGEIRFIDVTREVFIRDGYGNIPEWQASQWILCTPEKMFSMQRGRRITEIGDRKLEEEITMENYAQKISGLEKIFEEEVSLKSLAGQAISRLGNTVEIDCKKAKSYEEQNMAKKTQTQGDE